jgi:hypothetical protein
MAELLDDRPVVDTYGVTIAVMLSGELAEYAAPLFVRLIGQYPHDADTGFPEINVTITTEPATDDHNGRIFFEITPEFEQPEVYRAAREVERVVANIVRQQFPSEPIYWQSVDRRE